MIKNLVNFFPFFITLVLWYLSHTVFNPFGVLCIIPIFYYLFIDPIKYWAYFGFFMCFMLDFNSDTLFLFSAIFLIAKGVNDLFGTLNPESKNIGIKEFVLFLSAITFGLFIKIIFYNTNFWASFAGLIWLFLWTIMLYIPITELFRRIKNAG